MDILTHDEIQQHLQEVYDEQVRIYDASRILGSCVVGLANYNLAENMDEVRTVTVYVPTWEELCMVYPIYKEKDNNVIIDIRYYFNVKAMDIEQIKVENITIPNDLIENFKARMSNGIRVWNRYNDILTDMANVRAFKYNNVERSLVE